MKNLGTLFRYELKKIWTRRLTWAAAILLVAVCVIDASLFWWMGRGDNGYHFTYTSEDGTEYSKFLTSFDQIKMEGTNGSKLDGQIWDESYFETMRRSLPEVGGDSMRFTSYMYLVDHTYLAAAGMVGALGLSTDTVTAYEFYEARRAAAEAAWAEQGLTPYEISYWEREAEEIEEPFTYEYCKGAQFAITRASDVAMILPAGLAAILCGVFAEERRNRTVPLIFVSSGSRLPLSMAKVLAGSVTAGALAAVMMAATVVTELVLLGGGLGFGAPVQLYAPSSGLAISVGGALLILSGLEILYAVLFGGVIMLLSVTTGSSTAALACSVLPSIYLSIWVKSQERWADWLPGRLLSGSALENARLLGPLNILKSGALTYAAIALVMLALCALVWRRWAVVGK